MRSVVAVILLTLLLLPTMVYSQDDQVLKEAPRPKIFVRPQMLKRPRQNRVFHKVAAHRAHPDSIAASKPLGKDTTIEIDPSKSMIYLEHSNLIRFNEELMPGIQVLEGNVLLRHEGAMLHCDSAYLDQATNSFEAFGRVRMVQGDTLVITAKHLNYDGFTRMAHLNDKCVMRNKNVTLKSDSMIYNRDENLGYYQWGGELNDGETTLTSQHGYYHTDTKLAEFKYDVYGYNQDSQIESDTLTYDTQTRVAGLVGPTVIHYKDHEDPDSVLTVIYSDLGWYDTKTSQSELLNHSTIVYDTVNIISGDTIFYDNKLGYGRMLHNISMNDTANKMLLTGHYGYFQEKDEIGLVTDSACMTYYARPDTLYAHADTLYSFAVDTDKVALAYHNGRIYSHQYQAVSDSIVFNTIDSITHLMQLPIVWSDSMQVTGDTIRIYPKGESIDFVHVKGNAIIVQQEDTVHFNQLSGKEMYAFVIDSTLEHLEVLGNAESIFYPKDNGHLIGLNSMISSNTFAYFVNGEISKITVFPQPKATLTPMEMVTDGMLKLANFTWQIDVRPVDRYDIFNRPKRATKEELDKQKKLQREQQKAEKRKKRMEEQGVKDEEQEHKHEHSHDSNESNDGMKPVQQNGTVDSKTEEIKGSGNLQTIKKI